MYSRIAPLTVLALLVTAVCTWVATYIVKPDGTGDLPDIGNAVAAAAAGDTVLLTEPATPFFS